MKGKAMADKASGEVRSRAFKVLIFATAAYVLVYILLLIETKQCTFQSDGVFVHDNWFLGFWDSLLACRQVNELGDALAGAFAPVAFIWLAGAVFIQSQELQLQRKELELQREELDETQNVMREQLEVARQQVEETKATTALLKEQTAAISDERQRQRQRDADAVFAAMKDNFIECCDRRDIQYLNFVAAGTENLEQTMKFGVGSGAAFSFEQCISKLTSQFEDIDRRRNNGLYAIELSECESESLEGLRSDLQKIVDQLPKTSEGTRTRAEGYTLPAKIACLDWMLASNAAYLKRIKVGTQ